MFRKILFITGLLGSAYSPPKPQPAGAPDSDSPLSADAQSWYPYRGYGYSTHTEGPRVHFSGRSSAPATPGSTVSETSGTYVSGFRRSSPSFSAADYSANNTPLSSGFVYRSARSPSHSDFSDSAPTSPEDTRENLERNRELSILREENAMLKNILSKQKVEALPKLERDMPHTSMHQRSRAMSSLEQREIYYLREKLTELARSRAQEKSKAMKLEVQFKKLIIDLQDSIRSQSIKTSNTIQKSKSTKRDLSQRLRDNVLYMDNLSISEIAKLSQLVDEIISLHTTSEKTEERLQGPAESPAEDSHKIREELAEAQKKIDEYTEKDKKQKGIIEYLQEQLDESKRKLEQAKSLEITLPLETDITIPVDISQLSRADLERMLRNASEVNQALKKMSTEDKKERDYSDDQSPVTPGQRTAPPTPYVPASAEKGDHETSSGKPRFDTLDERDVFEWSGVAKMEKGLLDSEADQNPVEIILLIGEEKSERLKLEYEARNAINEIPQNHRDILVQVGSTSTGKKAEDEM